MNRCRYLRRSAHAARARATLLPLTCRFVVDEPPKLGGKGVGENQASTGTRRCRGLADCAAAARPRPAPSCSAVCHLPIHTGRPQPADPAAGLSGGLYPVHCQHDCPRDEAPRRGRHRLVRVGCVGRPKQGWRGGQCIRERCSQEVRPVRHVGACTEPPAPPPPLLHPPHLPRPGEYDLRGVRGSEPGVDARFRRITLSATCDTDLSEEELARVAEQVDGRCIVAATLKAAGLCLGGGDGGCGPAHWPGREALHLAAPCSARLPTSVPPHPPRHRPGPAADNGQGAGGPRVRARLRAARAGGHGRRHRRAVGACAGCVVCCSARIEEAGPITSLPTSPFKHPPVQAR